MQINVTAPGVSNCFVAISSDVVVAHKIVNGVGDTSVSLHCSIFASNAVPLV